MPICNGIGHWYLLVVIIAELRAEIWDPLASCMTTNLFLMEVHRIVSVAFTETVATAFSNFSLPLLVVVYGISCMPRINRKDLLLQLKCFDMVLNGERLTFCCAGIPFSSCEVSHPSLMPKDLHPTDSGLYVCLLMKQLHQRQWPLTEVLT